MAGNDSYTKSLLHMNGVDASTAFPDVATGGTHIWTARGTAQIDTAQSQFGGASALFDGNSDWIDTPDSADWNLGAGDWTKDFWARFNVTNTRQTIFAQYVDADNYISLKYWGDTNGSIHFYVKSASVVICDFYTGAWAPGSGGHHIAVVRTGNTPLIFIDGVSVSVTEGTTISGKTLPNLTALARIGYDGTDYFNGWLDEVRLSKGIARWVSDFTPPASEYSLLGNDFWFALEIPAVETDLDIVASVLSVELDIPAIELSASISQGAVLDFPLKVPTLEVSAAIKSGEKLSVSLPIPALEVSLGIVPRNAIEAALGITALRLSGAIISGGVLSVPIEIPVLDVVLTIGHQNQLDFALDIPFIDPWLEIRVIPALVPFRKGFVMNLRHFGVTEYNNFPFNSFCDYHLSGVYVGASENGIFILDGDDDNGVGINSAIHTGTEDLWSKIIRRLREGFVTMRGGEIAIEIILDEGRLNPVTRNLVSVRDVMHEERVKLPHGLKNRFASFIFRNSGGADFDLESLRIFCDEIKRRQR